MEVILLAAGQAMLMAVALLSWPLWLNAIWMSEHWPLQNVLGVLLAYSAILTLPIFLLRKRLLPRDVLLWSRALPVKPSARWLAHVAVVRLFIFPLGIAYALSTLACWFEMPAIHQVAVTGIAMMLITLALILLFGTLVLHLRQQSLEWRLMRATLHKPLAISMLSYQQQSQRPGLLHQWYKLFWLPFWRLENGIGIKQCILFISAAAMFWLWLQPGSPFVRFLFCISASSLALIVTDQGSKAVQEQMQRLRPHLRALPFALLPLEILSKFMCIIPANVLLALFAVLLFGKGDSFHAGVAHWYIGAQLIAQVIIVSLSHLSSAVRARIIILFMVILTAIGSELWN
ncbi:hypothetical protein ACO0LF_04600 [Undibacterium sp. Di27W]|uniref:hypothetical protein n=1 Tax=Undibacterium sp. Di27W TaxID=3413036 RepID=UPI003BF05E40